MSFAMSFAMTFCFNSFSFGSLLMSVKLLKLAEVFPIKISLYKNKFSFILISAKTIAHDF